MKIKLLLIILLIILLITTVINASAESIGNDYGYVNAWFNDEEATVKNINLKVGEPADIRVTITSNISGSVFLKLTNPLVSEPYQVIQGDQIGQRIDNIGVLPGWSKTFYWKIKPNGAWTKGNAPINIFVQFSKKGEHKKIEFTIANPYILDEQYEGAAPTPEKTTEAPETTSGVDEQPKASPFLSALMAIAVLVAMVVTMRLWRRK